MTAVIHMKPEGRYSDKDLERLVEEMREVVKQKEIMRHKEAAAFIGISTAKLYRSGFPYHRVEGMEGRFYLKSELIEYIKKS